ncbi:MAG: hypothetical protein CL916_15005 [Deltaproteobacteria bacterium]|nr:hypothetical protein [Deltaproteobacteria bacterium]
MRYLCLVPFFFACTSSEEGLKIYNSDPTATITSHVEGVELLESVEYTFIGLVADDNHSSLDLRVKWSTDARELCAENTPEADSSTSCRIALEASDTQLKLQVVDPEGAATMSSINIQVLETEAPTIELFSPTVDGSYYADQLVHFSAIINDAEDAPSDLSYVWESSLDGELSLSSPPTSDGTISGYLNLSEGQHAISLRVEDTTGKSNVADLAITVGGPNNDPLCDITAPDSSSGFVFGQNISFEGTGIDDDINNALLSVAWESDVDGVLNTAPPLSDGTLGFTTDQLSIGNHSIILKVEDEVGGLCTAGVQIVVGTPPSLTLSAPLSGDVFSLGNSVSFAGTVADQEDILSDIAISWVSDIDGEFSTQGSDSSGNIAFGYNGLSVGEHNLTITATDSDGFTSLVAQTLRINTPPSAPTISIAPTEAYTVDTLTVSANSEDADGDSVSFSYEWSGSNGGTYSGIMLPASETSVGETWTVRVTPNDGYVDGDYVESSITILNNDPVIDDLTIDLLTPTTTDTVTCSVSSSDGDGDPLSLTFEWSNQNSGAIYASTSSTSTSVQLDLSTVSISANDTLVCSVVSADGNGGSASDSTSVMVYNSGPSFGTPTSISPSIGVVTGSILTCSAGASDQTDGILTPSYTWSVGVNTIGTGISYTVSANDTDVGDAITCVATAIDSDGEVATSSASVMVENTDPVVSTVSISPSNGVYNDGVLSCSAVVTDPDENLSASYSWELNSIAVGSGSSLDLTTTSALPSDTVICIASVNDSNGGNDSASTSLTVENRAPTAPVVSISPAAPLAGDDLICSLDSTSVEPDGQSVNYSYEWTQNGVLTSNTTDSISGTNVGDGDTWICTVTPSDGTISGSSASATATVQLPWSGTATFTNCGQEGQTGPSQSQCDNVYSGTSLESMVLLNGGIQEWVVPTTGNYTIEAIGASGGDNPNASYCKGYGAQVRGDFDLQAGDVVHILIGQNPEVSNVGSEYGKGGGGGTFVWIGSAPLIIAGGGGGEGNESAGCNSYMDGQISYAGGFHSTMVSVGYGGAVTDCNWAGGGGAGWYSNGDSVSFSYCYAGAGGISPLNGGLGGDGNTCALSSGYNGDVNGGFGGGGGSGIHLGGGGGGYTGGEGGGYCIGTQEAAGGGSYNDGDNQYATNGYNDGPGMVIIDFN